MTRRKQKTTVHVKEQTSLAKEKSAEETGNSSHIEPVESTLQEADDMAYLQMILQELRDFCWENGDDFREIKEDIKTANSRVDEAEKQNSDT